MLLVLSHRIANQQLQLLTLFPPLCLRNNNLPRNPDDYNKLMLTRSLFCKENLPDRNFTFWEWFYHVLILTSNHLQLLWKEGHVTGFVSKEDANSKLVSTQGHHSTDNIS